MHIVNKDCKMKALFPVPKLFQFTVLFYNAVDENDNDRPIPVVGDGERVYTHKTIDELKAEIELVAS